MAKKGKIKRPAIKHSRTGKKGDTYIEERGLRRIELHSEKPPGKKSIFESEYPPDMARVLNRAAERFFEKTGEKTLDQVLGEAAATTGAATDPPMLDAKAIDNWVADLMDRHGALAPISVAAQFLVERRNIITLVENVPGAQLGAIDSATADKFAEYMERLFKHIYLFADAWHWWRMELHGDHQRLLDAHSVAASRQKGAASNQNKKSVRGRIIAEAVAKWKEANNNERPDPARIAGDIFDEVQGRLKPLNAGSMTHSGLIRVIRGLLRSAAA